MRVQVRAYRERYGSAFNAVGEALISAVMPLCPELARWHFGISDQQPAQRVHPRDSRWLEGLAKGQLESTFSQMAQKHRFGSPQMELESILIQRICAAPPLIALTSRMGKVQEKWISASAPVFISHLPIASPDKLILNQFATEWALATAYELKERANLCASEYQESARSGGKLRLETARMRRALSEWARAVLRADWREALRALGVVEQRWIELDLDASADAEASADQARLSQHKPEAMRVLSERDERCAAALHQAMKWVILGRWGAAFMALYHGLFMEEEASEEESFAESNTENNTENNTESTAESNTESTAESNTESTAESKTESTAESNTESTAESNTESTAESNTESNTESTAESNTENTAESTTESELYLRALAAFEAIEQLCALCQPPHVPLPLQFEDQLGGRAWCLEEPLGEGAWRAVDTSGMHGSLEEIWPLGDETWSQATQERALALSVINHPHIAPVQDWGIDPESGRWFMVSPFVYGESLSERVYQNPLSEGQARSFFLQITDALKRGLKVDLMHGQLRPENIIFYSKEQLALIRWGVHRAGIAGWRATTDQSPWRRCFTAPEAWISDEVSNTSEVYALGTLLAFALAPHVLELGHEWADILNLGAAQSERADSPWLNINAIPSAFRPLVLRATATDPEKRYSSVAAFEQALRELKPLYNYRGEYGERDDLSLMEVVSLILTKPNARHSIWRGHLNTWESWGAVDEIEQVVRAALSQQEEEEREREELEAQKRTEEAEAETLSEAPRSPRSPRSSKRSLVKKPALNRAESTPTVMTPAKRRRSPNLNPYLHGNSVAEEPGTVHTVTFTGVPLQLCYVPPGDFLMGSPRSPLTLRVERPQHVVTFKRPLLLGQTPITQGFYAALTGHNPSYFEEWESPIEQISWREAAEFCNLLSRLDGLEEVYEWYEEDAPEPEPDENLDEPVDALAHLVSASRERRGLGKVITSDTGSDTGSNTGSNTGSDTLATSTKGHSADGADPSVNSKDLDQSEVSAQGEREDGSDQESARDKKNGVDSKVRGHVEITTFTESVNPEGELDSLELDSDRSLDPALDEQRRLILEEGEDELDEKARRRYQIERVPERPSARVWVRCKLSCGGYRLPTEAEWEYAARANQSSQYSGSDQWRDVAWEAPPAEEGTQSVARLKPNRWGLYDLSGNVAEWCSDDQRTYTRNCVDPHQGASEEWTLLDTRVIRGGGWLNPKLHGRVAARGRCSATQRRNHIGFRVARPLLPIRPTMGSEVDLESDAPE